MSDRILRRLPLLAAVLLVAWLPLARTQDTLTGRQLVREPVTVFAVRHAEKGADDPRDPGLTSSGEARAAELARLLSAAGVTHLYSTDYRRTRDTLAPLEAATALDVELYDPGDVHGLAQRLRELPSGAVAVVAGHSNTTPGLVLALGGELEGLGTVRGAPALGEDEYDRLFQVTLPASEAPSALSKLIEFRYGG